MQRIVFAVAVLLALVVPAAGQPTFTEPPEVVIDDAQGDVQWEIDGRYEDAPDDQSGSADVLRFWFSNETQETISVGFQVREWGDGPTFGDERFVGFKFKDQRYRVMSEYCDGEFRPTLLAETTSQSSFSRWAVVACLEGRVNPATGVLEGTIPKEVVTDSSGVPLRFGDLLTQTMASTKVRSAQTFCCIGGNGTVYAVDRAPDQGFASPFRLREGFVGIGSVQMTSEQPVKWSNGEATTMSFDLQLINYGSESVELTLEPGHVPRNWEVRVPARVDVSGGGQTSVPVIVSTPFTHEHGRTETFEVVATSRSIEGRGEMEMGVHFPLVPQPSGHHDVVFVHTSSDRRCDPWFNAAPRDPDPKADERPVEACYGFGQGTESGHAWGVPLDPGLRMGILFERNRTGVFEATVTAARNGIHRLDVELWYCDPSASGGTVPRGLEGCAGAWVLMAAGESETQEPTINEPTPYRVPLRINQERLEYPYQGLRAGMAFSVMLVREGSAGASSPFGTMLQGNGSRVQLPLLEYHEPVVVEQFEEEAITLTTRDAPLRLVNPGKTVVWEVEFDSSLPSAREFTLEIEGHNKDWARWSGGPRIVVDPNATEYRKIFVQAPHGAVDGERAELFAVVSDPNTPSIVDTLRLRATVTTQEDIKDESGELPAGEAGGRSPGATAYAAVSAAFVGLVLSRRSSG